LSTVTKGEQIVRHTFNPSGSGLVHAFKEDVARLINAVEVIKDRDPRLAALAVTKLEEACMFAVKLATT